MSSYHAYLAGVRFQDGKIQVLFSIPHSSGEWFNRIEDAPAIVSNVMYRLKVSDNNDRKFVAFLLADKLSKLPARPVYQIIQTKKYEHDRPYVKYIGTKMPNGIPFDPSRATWKRQEVKHNVSVEEVKAYLRSQFDIDTVLSQAVKFKTLEELPGGFLPCSPFTVEYSEKIRVIFGTINIALPVDVLKSVFKLSDEQLEGLKRALITPSGNRQSLMV